MNEQELNSLTTIFTGHDGNTVYFYEDGFIVTVATGEDRGKEIERMLRRTWPDLSATQTTDGFSWLYVIKEPIGDATPEELMERFPQLAVTDQFKDNRERDSYTIELFVEWLNQATRG